MGDFLTEQDYANLASAREKRAKKLAKFMRDNEAQIKINLASEFWIGKRGPHPRNVELPYNFPPQINLDVE